MFWYQVLCVFLLTYFEKEIWRHKHLSIANKRKHASRELFEIKVKKFHLYRKIKHLQTERVKDVINKKILLRAFRK